MTVLQLSAATQVELEEVGALAPMDGRKCGINPSEFESFANSGWTNCVLPIHSSMPGEVPEQIPFSAPDSGMRALRQEQLHT